MASLKERVTARVARAARQRTARSTTPCGRRSTTARSRPASRPARSPTSGSCRSSRSWRSRSSSSATSPRSSPTPQDTLVEAINSMLPGHHRRRARATSSSSDIENAANTVGLIGLVGVLYTGLGWLSALRDALITVFALPDREQPNFVMGKLRDLITLAVIGVVLLLSRWRSPASSPASPRTCWTGLGFEHGLGLAGQAGHDRARSRRQRGPAPPDVPAPRRARPAVAGDVVRRPARRDRLRDPQADLELLIGITENAPAFQVFGLALILLVWINYASRVILYAAAWAWTAPAGRPSGSRSPPLPSRARRCRRSRICRPAGARRSRKGAFVAGAAAGAAAAAVIKSKTRRHGSANRSAFRASDLVTPSPLEASPCVPHWPSPGLTLLAAGLPLTAHAVAAVPLSAHRGDGETFQVQSGGQVRAANGDVVMGTGRGRRPRHGVRVTVSVGGGDETVCVADVV